MTAAASRTCSGAVPSMTTPSRASTSQKSEPADMWTPWPPSWWTATSKAVRVLSDPRKNRKPTDLPAISGLRTPALNRSERSRTSARRASLRSLSRIRPAGELSAALAAESWGLLVGFTAKSYGSTAPLPGTLLPGFWQLSKILSEGCLTPIASLSTTSRPNAPVAQLDRAPDYESGG